VSADATVAQALAEARARGVATLDARLMLGRLLGRTPTQLIAGDDQRLGNEAAGRWRDWLARRADGEPLAYLLGEKEFHGLLLEVSADVLVPRPETELLVDWAAELLAGARNATVLDLGTGSGAIALAVKQAHPAATVTAVDASPPALAVARGNARRLGLAVDFVESSWWRALDNRSFDLVLANPPYVRDGDPALAALRHEPRQALEAGEDGLAALREIVSEAPAHLEPGGWLLLEHGYDQAAQVQALLGAAGLEVIQTRADLAGHPRATGGRRPTRRPGNQRRQP
jgi:release factor glutamine methyltransferase